MSSVSALRVGVLVLALCPSVWAQPSDPDAFIQDVTPEQVARFVDPTVRP